MPRARRDRRDKARRDPQTTLRLPTKRRERTPAPLLFYASAYPGVLASLRGAKRPKQSSLSHSLDCFASLAMTCFDHLLPGNLLLAVGDAIDSAVPVVGDQE